MNIFAILTRRLIASHSFFKAPCRHLESLRVQTQGGSLKEHTAYFTTLRQWYAMNERLLTPPIRVNKGWGVGSDPERVEDLRHFTRFRPPEEYIDDLFVELQLYWDAIIATIPDLGLDPREAKNHQSTGDEGEVRDNALFWPIGQEVMVSVARALLDSGLDDLENPTLAQAKLALQPLARVDWKLHHVPWRGLLLVPAKTDGKWSMRSETRKLATDTGKKGTAVGYGSL